MQLLVLVFDIRDAEHSYNKKLCVIELKKGIDYGQLIYLMRKAIPRKVSLLKDSTLMTKELLKNFCELASTESDLENVSVFQFVNHKVFHQKVPGKCTCMEYITTDP